MTLKSSTTTKPETGQDDLLPLITPGEYLVEEFLQPLGLTPSAFAMDLHVPANRVTSIIKGQRTITADTALRMAQYFGTTPEFWMNLQSGYELDKAKREKLAQIQKQVPPRMPPGQERPDTKIRRSGD